MPADKQQTQNELCVYMWYSIALHDTRNIVRFALSTCVESMWLAWLAPLLEITLEPPDRGELKALSLF